MRADRFFINLSLREALMNSSGQGNSPRKKHLVCPACRSVEIQFLESLPDHWSDPAKPNFPETFPLYRCRQCSFTFLGEVPTFQALGQYYEEAAAPMRELSFNLVSKLKHIKFRLELNWGLAGVPKDTYHFIDFGTGHGHLALVLADLGYLVTAVDAFPSQDWKLSKIPYRQVNLDQCRFDTFLSSDHKNVLILRHVLEHLLEPFKFLSSCANNRVDRLMISVPRYPTFASKVFGKYWYCWDPPRHVSYFSLHTLTAAVERAGYRVKSSRMTGLDEVFSSLFRFFKLNPKLSWIAPVFAPTGALSSLCSAMAYFLPLSSVVEILAVLEQPTIQ
jgi:hypothetical protein